MLYASIYSLLLTSMSIGTDSVPEKRSLTLKTTVSITDTSEYRGYLSSINDSLIVVSSKKVLAGSEDKPGPYKSFHYSDLKEVSFKRTGSVGRGAVIGAASGLLIGAIYGLASYKEPPPGEVVYFDFGPGFDAVGYGAIGMISGAVIGGVIGGLATKRFIIKGKKERMRDAHEYIEARLNRTRN